MDLYKKMYYRLFNAVTDAINEENIEDVKAILIKAQQDTEEIYISYGESATITELEF